MKKFLSFFPGLFLGIILTVLLVGAAVLLIGSFYVNGFINSNKATPLAGDFTPLTQPGELFIPDQSLISAVNGFVSKDNSGLRIVSLISSTGSFEAVIAVKPTQYLTDEVKIPFLGSLRKNNQNEVMVKAKFSTIYDGKNLSFRFTSMTIGQSPVPLDLLFAWFDKNNLNILPDPKNTGAGQIAFDYKTRTIVLKSISDWSVLPSQFSLEDIRIVPHGILVRFEMDSTLPKKLDSSMLILSGTLPDLISTTELKLSKHTDLLSSLKELQTVVQSAQSVITQPASIQFSEPGNKLYRAGKEIAADIGVSVADGDRISTDKGRAEIAFPDGTIIKLAPKSSAIINMDFRGERSVDLTIELGSIRAISSKIIGRDDMVIRSSTAICSVRGTDFAVSFSKSGSFELSVLSGLVDLKAVGGSASEKAGFRERVILNKGKALVKSVMSAEDISSLDVLFPLQKSNDMDKRINTPETIQYKYLQILLNVLSAYSALNDEEKEIFEKDFPTERLAPLVSELMPEMVDFGLHTEESKK